MAVTFKDLRQQAKEKGLSTYHGKMCYCGSCERYTKRDICAPCERRKQAKRAFECLGDRSLSIATIIDNHKNNVAYSKWI